MGRLLPKDSDITGIRLVPVIWLSALLLFGGGCERSQYDPTLKVGDPQGHVVNQRKGRHGGAQTYVSGRLGGGLEIGGTSVPKPKESTWAGTGTFVQKVSRPPVDTTPGDVTLNFDGTDIREVVKVILGDLLQANYVLDPQVQGVASLETGRPLRREHLIPTLETLLRMNNAALVQSGGQYEVVPLTSAIKGRIVPQLGESDRALPNGYSVQVVPLRHIGAEEMNKILEPLAPEGSVVRVDSLRNLLLIAGTSPELGNLLDTIRVFDVDWMAGLSVGFFTLEYASATDVVTQLEALLADEGGNPFKGVFRFVAVESANSLLAVSPQEKYLKQAKDWIERLDNAAASGDSNERLFVYRVKHGNAENLADILTQLFSEGGATERRVGGVAPGLRRATAQSTVGGSSTRAVGGSTERSASGGSSTETSPGGQPSVTGTASRPAVASTLELSSTVSIVADTINNSLLIRSSPRDYKHILDALKQLDLVPLQVLVEATIVEITLAGNLQYGIQWKIFGGQPSGNRNDQRSVFSLTDGQEISQSFPGFNWAVIQDSTKIVANLNLLAGEGLVNVLSSPSVMVLDNQTAKIQVGKQVPVLTSQQQSTVGQSNLVNSIEYRDTGVQLSVKPRVTPGGLVQMEIEQEVSTVDTAAESSTGSPTFQTRNITSNVAVRSSQAVVLGGLIQDLREESSSGVPGLYDLPLIGGLFGERSKKADRTELVVVLTPRVIASDQDVEEVTRDFRSKLKGLEYKF